MTTLGLAIKKLKISLKKADFVDYFEEKNGSKNKF
jgi:hypothetical protein